MTMTPECLKAYNAWLAEPSVHAPGGFEYAWNAALKWQHELKAMQYCDEWRRKAQDSVSPQTQTLGDYEREHATRLTADDVRAIVREEVYPSALRDTP